MGMGSSSAPSSSNNTSTNTSGMTDAQKQQMAAQMLMQAFSSLGDKNFGGQLGPQLVANGPRAVSGGQWVNPQQPSGGANG